MRPTRVSGFQGMNRKAQTALTRTKAAAVRYTNPHVKRKNTTSRAGVSTLSKRRTMQARHKPGLRGLTTAGEEVPTSQRVGWGRYQHSAIRNQRGRLSRKM